MANTSQITHLYSDYQHTKDKINSRTLT